MIQVVYHWYRCGSQCLIFSARVKHGKVEKEGYRNGTLGVPT